MIKCKKCGCENPAYEPICNDCATEFAPTEGEMTALLAEADASVRIKDYRTAVDIYRFLAGLGNTVGEREFAIILKRGQLVPRDIPMAERYFFSAAKKGDPMAAYRYSRLVSRLNQDAGEFWLELSALLECSDAYSDASRLYSNRGDQETAAYYSSLLALSGDPDAIIDMARRHIYGNGVTQNERYSKWYINQLTRVPINAMGIAHKLHSVKTAYEPPKPRFSGRNKILRTLIARAKKYELRRLLLLLADLFARSDAKDATVDLAYLYIEGVEFEQNIPLGISLLEQAAEGGSAAGAKYLGDLFSEGKYAEADTRRAVNYYRQAASLGCDGAYEAIGDVFCDGRLTEPEWMLALSLYEKGAADGIRGCAIKARRIREEREKIYLKALEVEKKDQEAAFPLLLRSVSAGYMPANAKIAEYYENGIATEVNRKAAFKHYKAAVDAGDYRAFEGLGRCYARGIGVAFDFNSAVHYLTRAKKEGSLTADKELYRLYESKKRRMSRSLYSQAISLYYKRNFSEATELISTCVKLGMPEAIYTVGCFYEFGITLPQSREMAMKYYKKSADLGYKDRRGAHKQWLLRKSK